MTLAEIIAGRVLSRPSNLSDKIKHVLDTWDHWDYKVTSPIATDDEAEIAVTFKWQDGRQAVVIIVLEPDGTFHMELDPKN